MKNIYIEVKFPNPKQPKLHQVNVRCPVCHHRLYFPFFTTLDGKIKTKENRYAIKLINDPMCQKGDKIKLEDYLEYIENGQTVQSVRIYHPLEHNHSKSLSKPANEASSSSFL